MDKGSQTNRLHELKNARETSLKNMEVYNNNARTEATNVARIDGAIAECENNLRIIENKENPIMGEKAKKDPLPGEPANPLKGETTKPAVKSKSKRKR